MQKNGRQFTVHGPQQKLTNHEEHEGKDKDQKKLLNLRISEEICVLSN